MTPNGRPTAYRRDFSPQARNHCLLGATNQELGACFGVARRTIDNCIAVHPVQPTVCCAACSAVQKCNRVGTRQE